MAKTPRRSSQPAQRPSSSSTWEALVMPNTGEGVSLGTVVHWLKGEGDHVDRDEGIVEVETEKVNIEIPAPRAGILKQILIREGDDVPVGEPLAYIELAQAKGGTAATSAPAHLEQRGTLSSRRAKSERAGGPSPSPAAAGEGGVRAARSTHSLPPRGGGLGRGGTKEGDGSAREARQHHSPAVLAIAREHDVDLSKVPGTGHEGRVTRQDVLAYISGQDNASAKPIMSVPLADDAILFISPTRRTIAEHMVESARNIPHAWFSVEADLTNLVALRGDVKDDFRLHKGVDLTYLPFAVKAAIDALGKHPIVNSSWVDEGILQKKEVRIGIAMATDRGLVVPVIPDAARLSITQLARTISDLVERARARRLKPEDVEGGTFTINNTGAFGSVMSMPIINYPQAAILTLEAIVPRPVVHENAIVIRQMANLCLSFDHRVLDGSQAGAFLATVKANLESFGPGTKLDP